ncbi:hypothetical protein GALL_439840 [mine drainage metagenome]|uniref:Uncharacterized protein n=1 Tax=mine drainage metagenome TaxID=410659 RepID=A0A1J5Q2Z3_9ZZZZ
MLHRHVRLVSAVHAGHAEKLRIGTGDRPQAHQGVGAGVLQQIGQLAQFGRGIREDHPAAAVDVGPLGRQQQLHRLADLPAMSLAHRVVRPHLHGLGVVEAGGMTRHVFRHIHHHRTGASGAGDVESLFHHRRQIAHVLDQEVVFHHRTGDAHGVALLEGVETDGRGRHLAGDDHHRNRIHIGRGDAGDRIGRSGARRHQRHADLARRAGVSVGGMNRCRFLPHQHVLDRVLFVELVVDVEHCPTGVAPHVFHALFLKAANENFRTGDFRPRRRVRFGSGRCGRFDFRAIHIHEFTL